MEDKSLNLLKIVSMTKMLPNLPIENLTSENDYIGIIEKGNLIKSFFLSNKHEFSRIKMFALYGEWGSGKSTLMKYLQKELKGSFNTFFFESWEFESDKNLAQSLIEFLANETDSKKENFLKNGYKLMEGFAKSTTFKTPIANFSMKSLVEEVDSISFYERKELFEKDFIEWENKITTKDKSPDYNIVFIDDLDRCEPENILNLLSAIKLFFTFGKKTIFLCGIDKKAIREAVKTKYGEIVKANEYLEKIFDISFSMPNSISFHKLIGHYFDKIDLKREYITVKICVFFDRLNFKNPRRIKKILNKYLILNNLKKFSDNQIRLPNIYYQETGTYFETCLTLYLLILKEFEPENFNLLFNLSFKRMCFIDAMKKSGLSDNEFRSIKQVLFNYFREGSEEKMVVKGLDEKDVFRVYLANFLPNSADKISSNILHDANYFIKSFHTSKKSYEYYFVLFMFENENEFSNDIGKMIASLSEYKEMISNLI